MTSKELLDKLYLMYPNASCELKYNNEFEFLCAVILSAQTTDKAVNLITPKLFAKYKNVYELSNASISNIIEIIKPLGLSKNKSRYLIDLSKEIVNKHDGIIPKTISELEKLPGVGHKTACVYMSEIYKEQHIAVDTHVKRVSNRLGISNENDVLKIQVKLEKYFDKSMYIKAHHGLLFLGRYKCKSKNPECSTCLLNNICQYKGDKDE